MTFRTHLTCCLFTCLLAGLARCADENASPDTHSGTTSEPFSTFPGEPNHEAITGLALSFLRPEIVSALQAANVATDVEFFLVNANHFDDCNFSGGSAVVKPGGAGASG